MISALYQNRIPASSPNGRSPHAHQLRCLSRFLPRRPARQLHQSRRGAAVQPAQPYPNHPQSGIGARLYALCAQQPRRGAHAGGRKAVCARCRRLRTDSGGRGRAGQRPQPAKRRGLHRRERNGAARLSSARARRVPPRPSGDSPAHCQPFHAAGVFRPAQRLGGCRRRHLPHGGHKRPAHRAARPIRGGARLRPVADALMRSKTDACRSFGLSLHQPWARNGELRLCI